MYLREKVGGSPLTRLVPWRVSEAGDIPSAQHSPHGNGVAPRADLACGQPLDCQRLCQIILEPRVDDISAGNFTDEATRAPVAQAVDTVDPRPWSRWDGLAVGGMRFCRFPLLKDAGVGPWSLTRSPSCGNALMKTGSCACVTGIKRETPPC